MKHLKLFLNDADYQNFVKSDDYVKPNVSYARDTDTVYYNPYAESVSSYKMVDLGLPSGLKWADRNIGADSPEDAGLYFAWGETVGYTLEQVETTKEKYFDWGDYFDTTDNGSTFNKYATDKLTVLEASDDAATVNMGSNWRMPTDDEYKELINNTTATYISFSGNEFSYSEVNKTDKLDGIFKGLKLTSKVNSNSIFIPAAGYVKGFSGYNIDGFQGNLWTSSLSSPPTITPDANALFASVYYRSAPKTSVKERCYGQSVRGVCN